MNKTHPMNAQMEGHARRAPLSRGIAWGLLGGLAGTLAMDLVLMGGFAALGLPATTCFALVGDTIARFFSLEGVDTAGSVQLGILTHYLVGPALGTIFGVIAARRAALRASTLKKVILVAIVYVEVLSQPLLATAPILLKMDLASSLQWYGGSFVVHMIVGIILGAVVSRGLRQAPASRLEQVESIPLQGVGS